jgi:hypothetical protein
MPFSRIVAPAAAPDEHSLTAALVSIGMNFAAEPPAKPANIEDTLLFASERGMDHSDLRVLAVLVTWFGVHHPWVNADRITRLVTAHSSMRVRALWAALALWQRTDHRFARLSRLHEVPRVDVETDSEFLVRRHGEDPRFAKGPVRVAAVVLRDRPSDVLEPGELAARHAAYRWRILLGPSYRADMFAALEQQPTLSAAELARRCYGSFTTAWQVKRDYELLGVKRTRPVLTPAVAR